MTVYSISSAAELQKALSQATGGDTIILKAGDYGDVSISKKMFSGEVTITSADPGNPATFHSISITGSSGLKIDNVDVDFQPNLSTYAWSNAVKIADSSNIAFVNSTVKGGPAINGVAQDAPVGTTDPSGNVLGLPTGRGVWVNGSDNVRVENVEISEVAKGLVLGESTNLTIRDNEIHHTRTSSIVGTDISDSVIDGNHLYSSHPNNFGGEGDHADFIHLWTDPTRQDGASKNIQISNNVIEQGDGHAILGIYIDDNGNNLGFQNLRITDNVVLNGNAQGLRLENVDDSVISGNVLLQTSGTYKQAPGILIAEGSEGLTVSNNVTASIQDKSGATDNTFSDNQLAQKWNSTIGGYYTDALINKLSAADSGISSTTTTIKSALSTTLIDATTGSKATSPSTTTTVPTAPTTTTPPPTTTPTTPTTTTPTEAVSTPTKTPITEPVLSAPEPVVTAPRPVTAAEIAGTDGADRLTAANGSAHILKGGAGDDYLTGKGGDDQLFGGVGNDTMTGGDGSNAMCGGAGDDTYYLKSTSDSYFESAGEGVDTIASYISHTLGANVENLRMLEAGATGTGNGLANYITAADGGSSLNGMGGADTINGKAGHDLIYGGDGDDALYGQEGNDSIYGGAGADTINGGAGSDWMSGGAGADQFKYGPVDVGQAGVRDVIADFNRAEGDKIHLASIDANTLKSSDQAFAFIGNTGFHKVAGELNFSTASGKVIVAGDVNGDGVADFQIEVLGVTSLTSSDFVL